MKTNGIRRYAAPVKSIDGTLIGILSLAEIYTPDSEKYSKKLIKELLITANKIEQERTRA